ncbi:MAG: hypothetical protein LBC59_06780 [Chitinispirillales bacterium]|jgi:hypothetical protein|nr:hypothetical protein [Chitinispirillales bacterium]
MTTRLSIFVFVLTLFVVSAGFAQKAPAPGTHITVSKTTTPTQDNPDVGMYRTIQEAVNAATNGQVIEILDTEIYDEQVTIDGRDVSPWDGHNGGITRVVGKKNGITIRYVPTAAEKARGNYRRPTIRYKDTRNQSPKTPAESTTEGELPGSSGNFETCGALRIIRAQGVTIDGIAVDGGGQSLFAWPSVWNSMHSLVHGNAAITLVVAGGAVIRNCDLRNAYIGLNVKDRNTGGVFGMRNPADPDDPVPLSGFGKVGYHLIEYNRIHENALGIFFESAWDLGSTVRYNLVYNNVNDATTKAFINGGSFPGDVKQNMASGAIMFKDMVYSPVAIYNNTFYRNEMNFIGNWKIGAPHLLFNNIFGKSTVQVSANGANAPAFGYDFMAMDGMFQYRMHNSTFSAYLKIDAQGQEVYVDYTCSPQSYDTLWVRDVSVWNSFATPVKSKLRIDYTYCGKSKEEDAVVPGALLTGGSYGFPTDANIRWLEMSRQTVTTTQSRKSLVLPDLFQSTDTANPKFLWPDWDHQYVKDYIQNKGWQTVGIRNADGQIADLGAISSNNDIHQPTLVRIKPTNVVLLSGTTAKASFFLTLESGTMTNPKIKFLRWIVPLPNAYSNFGGSQDPIIKTGSIHNITPPATTLNFGPNNLDITIPSLTVRDSLFGFFEMVVEGTNANGQTVSDVGFLPYRNLDYKLDIRVFAGNATTTTGRGLDTVRVGEPYKMVVTPQRSNGTSVNYNLNEVTYDLLSDAAAFMYNVPVSAPPQNPLVQDVNLPSAGKTYNVYFTHAGAETIMGAGVYDQGANHLVFLGTKDLVVRPGSPDRIVFVDPIPSSQLGTAPPTVINRGVDREVLVEVRDKYDNPVDTAVGVSILSDHPEIGDIAVKNVNTDRATGIATFIARTGPSAASGQIFEMTASFASGSASGSDKGKLRVGRAFDRLEVFYSDNGPGKQWQEYFDPTAVIDTTAGAWVQITVKVVVGDSVNTGRPNQFVLISPSDNNLVFSATAGGTPAVVFPLNAGVATFWVSTAPGANRDISNAGINVYALRTNSADDIDASISSGGRENINFTVPVTAIEYAVVYGDGQGRPDSVLIRYFEGGTPLGSPGAKPSKVTLNWIGSVLTAEGADVSVVSDIVLRAVFTGASRPAGKTSISGVGSGLVKVYGGSGGADVVEEVPSLYDGIGPVLANGVVDDGADGAAPLIYENADGDPVDTLVITISEDIRDESSLTKLRYTVTPNPIEPAGPTDGIQLNVISAAPIGGRSYKLAVTHTDDGPIPEGWIRLDPGVGSVTDRAATQSAGIVDDNKPHDRNRWVKLSLQGRPPTVKTAWYTANSATGKPDYAYVEFNKSVDNLGRWFTGGSVNFDGARAVSDVDAFFSVVDGSTLRIDLSAATSFASPTSTVIRTSGEMPFTLTFGQAVGEWGSVSVVASDRAKPVLALGAELRTGSPKGTGEGFNQDTLVVYYSEQINAASLTANNPITLRAKGGKYAMFQPELQMLGSVVSGNGFYMTRYLVVNEIPQAEYPESGDSVHIYHLAGIGDAVDSSNVQDKDDNKWQPLTVKRAANWKISIGSNPFMSDASGSKSMGFLFDPRSRGVTKMTVKANIRIFDNVGTLVIDTTVDNGDGSGDKMVSWRWRGENKKGRLVGTGTYLLKATCESKAEGDSKPDVYKVPTQMLGVVRGKQ